MRLITGSRMGRSDNKSLSAEEAADMREFFRSQYGQFILVTIAVVGSGLAGAAIASWMRW